MRRPEQKATLTFGLTERTPLQRFIVALINDFEHAAFIEDHDSMDRLKDKINAALDEFDLLQGDGHSNPAWIGPVMRANAISTFGDLVTAVELESEGLRHARTNEEQAKSHNNLSDHFRRMGNGPAAMRHAREAFRLWPENQGIVVNLLLALYRCGDIQGALGVLGELAAESDESAGDILSAHLKYEEELQDFVRHPEVIRVLESVEES